jgi:ERCC4-related helicase/ERCC4-type nuclease
MFVRHPRIKPNKVELRLYQQVLFGAGVQNNTLIVLPTGLGKTIIVVLLMAFFLDKNPEKKMIITAPTRPLVEQHFNTLVDLLDILESDIVAISGGTAPNLREQEWKNKKIFVSTPQTLRNDIIAKFVDLKDVSFLCIDEAHRCVGEDASVLAVEQFTIQNPEGRIVGITASPGNKMKMQEIIKNLNTNRIEYMDEVDPKVKPYVHQTSVEYLKTELPNNFKSILSTLNKIQQDLLIELKELKVIKSSMPTNNPRRKLIDLPSEIQEKRATFESENEFFQAMSAAGNVLRIAHALELVETQGIPSLHEYLLNQKNKAKREKKASLMKFLRFPGMSEIIKAVEDLYQDGEIHPKIDFLKEIVQKQLDQELTSRILVFSNYRSTSKLLTEELNKLDVINAHWFVGQTSSKDNQGLKQKEQIDILNRFKSGEFNVLVSTSVGEEGLDVAQCDLVVFYDVVPSSTRLIQRSGRTGRSREGKVVILIAKGTRDEGYHWASQKRKSKLKEDIEELQSELEMQKQSSIDEFLTKENTVVTGESEAGRFRKKDLMEIFDEKEDQIDKTDKTEPVKNEEKEIVIQNKEFDSEIHKEVNESELISADRIDEELPIIYVDSREKNTSIVRSLLKKPINLIQEILPIGDYLLSGRVVVERKSVSDLAETIKRGDLFTQLINLKNTYEKPILLVEGNDLFNQGLHKNAVYGAISSINIDLEIPIIYTKDTDETVEYLVTIATREQKEKKEKPYVKTKGSKSTMYDEQITLISQLPKINRLIAERLLEHFNTPREIFSTNQNELRKVKGIGKVLADRIDLLLSTPFNESKKE